MNCKQERGIQTIDLVSAYRGMGLTDAQIGSALLGDDLPDPPDNFDIFNSFPEHFRDKIANQFTSGIEAEYDGIRARVQREYAVARARQKERDERRNRPAARGGRGRR